MKRLILRVVFELSSQARHHFQNLTRLRVPCDILVSDRSLSRICFHQQRLAVMIMNLAERLLRYIHVISQRLICLILVRLVQLLQSCRRCAILYPMLPDWFLGIPCCLSSLVVWSFLFTRRLRRGIPVLWLELVRAILVQLLFNASSDCQNALLAVLQRLVQYRIIQLF